MLHNDRVRDSASTPGPTNDSGPRGGDGETVRMPASETIEPAFGVGAMVSRYVTLEELGHGGMGRVVRAYDPKLQREVALKEVRSDALDAAAAQRLVAEARAMAKLSHPNVVAVYDVELVSPTQVVLVMEYVPGSTLKDWLERRQRSWPEVIRLFAAAGRGLAAAHEAGLLHRDFKPANVLVADLDSGNSTTGADRWIVKVTDFGVAKAAAIRAPLEDAASSERSVDELTKVGSVMGTPRYMAPEQHRGRELTAAADQYAFCLALWEGLFGESPFGDTWTVEAKQAGPRPRRAGEMPRPILDALARGLAPRPGDRWPSMADLIVALERGPARRRFRVLATAGTLVASGLGFFGYQWWTLQRAQRCSGAQQQISEVWREDTRAQIQAAFAAIAKPYADQALAQAEEQLDDYAQAWAKMHTDACTATTIRAEQSPQLLDLRMACLHRAAVELRSVIAVLADADAKVVQKSHELTSGLPPLARCADTDALAAEVEPPDDAEAERVEAARVRLAEADARNKAGRFSAANEALEEARELLHGVRYVPVQAEMALTEGHVKERLGDYTAAEAALTNAIRLTAKLRQSTIMREASLRLLVVLGERQKRIDEALRLLPLTEGLSEGDPRAEARLRSSLAIVLSAQARYAEAEASTRAAIALLEAEFGPRSSEVAGLHANLATTLYYQGDAAGAAAEYKVALAVLETTLGPHHPFVAGTRGNLASALFAQGNYALAEAEHRRAVAVIEAALGPDHPHTATSRDNLGLALAAQGEYAEAEAEHRAALVIREAALRTDHPDLAQSRDNLAGALFAQGMLAEAEAEHRKALASLEASLGADHPSTAASRNNLARVLSARGNYIEAEAHHRKAIAAQENSLGADHPDVALARDNLGLALSAQGKLEAAEVEHRRALAAIEATQGSDHPDTAALRTSLAQVLLKLVRPAEALPLAELAWSRQQRDDTVPPLQRAHTGFVLAQALWQAAAAPNDRARARILAESALRAYVAAGDAHRDDAERVKAWIASPS